MAERPWVVAPAASLRGKVHVPGDKSISHRAVLFNLLASGPSTLTGLLQSEDLRATLAAAEALGATFTPTDDGVRMQPPSALREPDDAIDCGNSGTTLRLLTGLLAGTDLYAVLTGDASLRRRPMARITEPLRAMGARIDGRHGGARAPLTIRGPTHHQVAHELPVASAQVLGCLLLAGRHTGVSVHQPGTSRDHSQRMLAAMGVDLDEGDGWVRMSPIRRLDPLDLRIPGDLSSAAFWLVAASIVPGSEIVLPRVGVNPTRAGILDALQLMGADIALRRHKVTAEPTADIRVRSAPLRAARIQGSLALRALDELPILAIAAAFADGTTVISDAAELRVKESDRIARVTSGLRALGVEVEELDDGWRIVGGTPRGPATIDATGDHRIAMAFAVAALVAGPITLVGARAIQTSYPSFPATLEGLRGA